MARVARTVIKGIPYHITQRGNNKQDIFFVDDDRKVYLDILKRQSIKYGLTILGYCLMDNHIHIIAIPATEDALANAIGRTHFTYTQYINRFHSRSGHLWQNRFYSCGLDERYLLLAMRYIERNPVAAGICHKAWLYEWSSAIWHTDAGSKSDLLDLRQWYGIVDTTQWKDILSEGIEPSDAKKLAANTYSGRPLGSDSFISKLEKAAGCRLRPLPVGRPKKQKEENN
jgi:putative transposase